jgi:hypothetical protein
MKKHTLFTLLLISMLALVSCDDSSETINNLEGTVWCNDFFGEIDTLRFFAGNASSYYLAESHYWAPCTYIPKDDTLYLMSAWKSMKVEVIDLPDPEIVRKLVYHDDTLTVVFQAIYKGEDMKVTKPVNFHFTRFEKEHSGFW